MFRLSVMALLLGACVAGEVASPEAAPAPTTSSTTSSTSPPSIPTELYGFPIEEIRLAGEVWRVAVADTPERRARGLMGVTDLGGVEGMLFVFPEPTGSRFWMKDTLIPLDIAFFAADGSLVEVLRMEPCRREPCPTYGPDDPYRWALEAPAGGLAGLPAGTRLAIPGG